MIRMKGLDLFSGIGGISLALSKYVETTAYCEIDPYCRAVLQSRMKTKELDEAIIHTDVKSLNQYNLGGEYDIISGGFPCQDLSVAGHGKGLEGQRSGLFFEIIRLTKEIRPTFVFLENVPAIRTRGLEQVIKEFTEIRYDCRWTCLSAGSIGAPHKRERWFLLAHTDSSKLWEQSRRRERQDRSKTVVLRYDGKERDASDSMCEGLPRYGQIPERTTSELGNISDYSWGAAPSGICGMDDGISKRLDRIKCLGNSVVPAQVEKAFRILSGIDTLS